MHLANSLSLNIGALHDVAISAARDADMYIYIDRYMYMHLSISLNMWIFRER